MESLGLRCIFMLMGFVGIRNNFFVRLWEEFMSLFRWTYSVRNVGFFFFISILVKVDCGYIYIYNFVLFLFFVFLKYFFSS